MSDVEFPAVEVRGETVDGLSIRPGRSCISTRIDRYGRFAGTSIASFRYKTHTRNIPCTCRKVRHRTFRNR